jgi:hypothetical protein
VSGRRLWSRRDIFVAGFVAAWIGVQVVVASVGLTVDRPARFTWQMYAALAERHVFVLVWDDGREEEKTTGQLLHRVRADIEYSTTLPEHLCRVRDGLEAVEVTTRAGDVVRIVPCGP